MQSGPVESEGGSTQTFETERASATPVAGPSLGLVTRTRQPAAAPLAPHLAETQRWFLNAITHPRSVEAGLRRAGKPLGVRDARRLVTPGPQLDEADRMRIYHYAYRARLVECLADDFPTVRHALGTERFERLAASVIVASPSRGPNLNGYGAVLVDYLHSTQGRVQQRRFCADLSRLEWALVQAVHAAPAEALDLAALQALPLEQWPGARFDPSPSLRVLSFNFPVNRFLQAFREDRAPKVPRAAVTATAVYRRGYAVWRMDLAPEMRDLLDALIGGMPLGQALEPLEGHADPARVMQWFTTWVSSGFFSAVRV